MQINHLRDKKVLSFSHPSFLALSFYLLTAVADWFEDKKDTCVFNPHVSSKNSRVYEEIYDNKSCYDNKIVMYCHSFKINRNGNDGSDAILFVLFIHVTMQKQTCGNKQIHSFIINNRVYI